MNCATVLTDKSYRFKKEDTWLSNLISSSLVTMYFAFPFRAVSRIMLYQVAIKYYPAQHPEGHLRRGFESNLVLEYSLIIEAAREPDFFGFYSPYLSLT